MPSSTGRGFPYPIGSDPLSDIDLAVKALAEFLELNVRAGRVNAANTSAGGDVVVAINPPMAAVPAINVTPTALAIGHIVHVVAVATNSFTVRFREHDNTLVASAPVTFDWQAIVR